MVSARAEEVFVGRIGMWEDLVGVMREGGSGFGGSDGDNGGWSGVGLEGKVGRLGDTVRLTSSRYCQPLSPYRLRLR